MNEKQPRNPDVRKFVDYAYQTYWDKYSERLVITAADTANAKRVLTTVELERLKLYWDWFLNYDQLVTAPARDFILKNATRDIKTFCGHINRIIQHCRFMGQGTTSNQANGAGYDPVTYAEVAASTRADELYNTMDEKERERRIMEIEKRLMKTRPGWDSKVYRHTAIAILKQELEDGI